MEEDRQFSQLIDFLRAVETGSPEFSLIRLGSQSLTLTVAFMAGQEAPKRQKVEIEAFSVIGYQDASREVTFQPPMNDLSGSAPSIVFSLEGERIERIELTENTLRIATARAILALGFHDGPWEAILIRMAGEADAFIL